MFNVIFLEADMMITKAKVLSLSLSGFSRVLGYFKTLISFSSNVSASPLSSSSDVSGANYSGDPETFHPRSGTIAQDDSAPLVLDPRRTFAGAKTSRMTHYGFGYKCRARHAFLGRSMIEMLGVLAVIAVLSVAGIAGFNKAMTEYKITKTLNQYGELFNNMLTHQKQLRHIADEHGKEKNIGNELHSLNIVPEGWKYSSDGVTDPLGVFSYVQSRGWMYYAIRKENQLAFSTFIKTPYLLGDDKLKVRFCQRYIADVIKPLSFQITLIESGSWSYHGDNSGYCKRKTRPCLRDITPNEISQFCSKCLKDEWCSFWLYF